MPEEDNQTRTTPQRISAKEAAQSAAEYYRDVTGDNDRVVLEEIELTEDEAGWRVTLSHRDSASYTGDKRLYKRFLVDANTGEVLAMKIRRV